MHEPLCQRLNCLAQFIHVLLDFLAFASTLSVILTNRFLSIDEPLRHSSLPCHHIEYEPHRHVVQLFRFRSPVASWNRSFSSRVHRADLRHRQHRPLDHQNHLVSDRYEQKIEDDERHRLNRGHSRMISSQKASLLESESCRPRRHCHHSCHHPDRPCSRRSTYLGLVALCCSLYDEFTRMYQALFRTLGLPCRGSYHVIGDCCFHRFSKFGRCRRPWSN